MICYKDISFCADASHCAKTKCFRRYTDEECKNNEKIGFLPVALAHFKDTCPDYKEKHATTGN